MIEIRETRNPLKGLVVADQSQPATNGQRGLPGIVLTKPVRRAALLGGATERHRPADDLLLVGGERAGGFRRIVRSLQNLGDSDR